jgi:hypothetical protein
MSDTPPDDIAKLIQYIESQGIPCEYTPCGSFEYLELIIKDVQEFSVDMDSEISIWVNDHNVELDRSQYPISLSSVRIHGNVLTFHFEPSYYRDDR